MSRVFVTNPLLWLQVIPADHDLQEMLHLYEENRQKIVTACYCWQPRHPGSASKKTPVNDLLMIYIYSFFFNK